MTIGRDAKVLIIPKSSKLNVTMRTHCHATA